MAGDFIAKIGTQAINPQSTTAGSVTGKDSPSNFDEVKNAKKTAGPPEVPPLIETLDAKSQKAAETQLVKKMESGKSGPPLFTDDLSRARKTLDTSSKKVQQLPKSAENGPLRQRMTVLEDQYQATEQSVKKLGSLDNPKELLQMQVEVYRCSQNIELFSKVVESATSSTKQLLQTQVG